MSASDEKIMRALGRILRTWSLIKFVPMRSVLPLQAPLLRLLSTRPDLSEDQLVALGIKRLYSSRNTSKHSKSASIRQVQVKENEPEVGLFGNDCHRFAAVRSLQNGYVATSLRMPRSASRIRA